MPKYSDIVYEQDLKRKVQDLHNKVTSKANITFQEGIFTTQKIIYFLIHRPSFPSEM